MYRTVNDPEQIPTDKVVRRVAELVAASIGLDPAVLTEAEMASFATTDILGGSPELCGHTLDSLAIAELLVEVDERFEVSILDWIDEDLDVVRPADLARMLVSHVPADRVAAWVSSGPAGTTESRQM